MFRRVLLSAVSSVALVSSALAADIYTPSVPAYAAVAFPPTWGGFYLGVNGGYGGDSGLSFRDNVTYTPAPPALPGQYAVIDGKSLITGGFGGGQLGYNWQFGGFVVGFETDIQGSNIQGSGDQAYLTAPVSPANFCGAAAGGGPGSRPCAARNDLDVDWFGTVRGRLGYAFGGTLLYVTGGFAYGGVNESASYIDNEIGATTPLNRARVSSSSTTQTGWAAGAGIEQKISPSWSVKGEYQFVDLGTDSTGSAPLFNVAGAAPVAAPNWQLRAHDSRVQFNTVRVGINYLFNAPEPLPLK